MPASMKRHTNLQPALYPHRVHHGSSRMVQRHKCILVHNDYYSLQIRLHSSTSHYLCSNLYRMNCPSLRSQQRHYGGRMVEALSGDEKATMIRKQRQQQRKNNSNNKRGVRGRFMAKTYLEFIVVAKYLLKIAVCGIWKTCVWIPKTK